MRTRKISDILYGWITRYMAFTGMTLYAFDPKDPADKKLLDDAVAAAVKDATEGLSEKNKELLAEVKSLKRGREIKPEQLEALESENEELKSKLKDAEKATTTAKKAAEDAGKALEQESGYTRGLLVDQGLTAALMDAGVKNPVHLKAAAALLKSGNAIEVKVDGGTRSAVVGDKPLADFVKAWSQSDEGKAFVSATPNSGSGAGGGSGGGSQAGNMGGTPAERAAAIKAQFPELSQ